MPRTYQLEFPEWRRLSRRAYRAQQNGCHEICGVFSTTRHNQLRLYFLPNDCPEPGKFELSWQSIGLMRTRMRAADEKYLGIFHSHPISEAIPDPEDICRSTRNAMLLIYDVCGVNARLWKISHRGRKNRAIELSLEIHRAPQRR